MRHVHCRDRPLVFIPLQLAGEANAPLAALVGDDRDKPRLLTVTSRATATQRFEFAADARREVILPYIEGYAATGAGRRRRRGGLPGRPADPGA